MGLRDFAPATETIQLPGGDTFVVRGLALEDITVLLRSHYDTAAKLFDKYVNAAATDAANAALPEADFGSGGMRSVALEALQEAPTLIADVIAQAADEPELAPLVKRLPLGTQIEAAEAVIRLTLEAEGGLEKLIETVNKLTSSLAGLGDDRSR
jgi:hypothetical protein